MPAAAPASIRVGPFPITVHYAERLVEDSCGGLDADRLVILVDANAPPMGARDTLLHEALHAVLILHGIAAALDMDRETAERLVLALTPALLALLRDNPQLVAYVTADD